MLIFGGANHKKKKNLRLLVRSIRKLTTDSKSQFVSMFESKFNNLVLLDF